MSEKMNGHTPPTAEGPDVAEVLLFLHNSMKAAAAEGHPQKACILIFVDEGKQWAAQTSGLDLANIKELLTSVRDNAVLGGQGFTVLVNRAEPAVLEMPTGTEASNAPTVQ